MYYNDLEENTKIFLNKAMDIYSVIETKRIVETIRDGFHREKYEFTKLDKKVLSLFIAGFLVEGNLKEILSQYDDIKLDDLLDFIRINQKQIVPMTEEKYEEFFRKYFKFDLMNIIEIKNQYNIINFITPEIIVSSLQYVESSDILYVFAEKYGISKGFFGLSTHPLFETLQKYIFTDGSISEIDFFGAPKKLSKKQQTTPTNFEDENIWSLLDEINSKFVGQEGAAEGLFYNIINNQLLAKLDDLPDGQRSIIFLDGSTGTGKTAIVKEITEKLGIPFSSTSVTNYSSTGYVGGDITDTLKDLYRKANGDLENAERGIIVFDEFDKIAYSRSEGLEMKRAVQQQLLDFLGGGKYYIHMGNNKSDVDEFEFDTSKLTFICLGALTDLRAQKIAKKQPIGFRPKTYQAEELDYTITPQDLIGIGLERELVGRFNTYLHTNDYSKENLTRILKDSTISPLISFRKWIESKGKKLEIDEAVYGLIVDQAYELNTGARSLQTVMNNIRTHYIKEVLRGTSDTIYLDSETVEKVNAQMMGRKGRA